MVRELNKGNHKAACDALMLYTRARGKFVQGLANRRAAERKICLTPDSATSAATRIAAVPTVKPKVVPDARPNDTAPAPKRAPKMFSWAWWTER